MWASYAGLKSQQRPGVPWFDLLTRGRRGDDPSLFFSHIGGPDGWRQIPWITEAWVESMRRQFEFVPSKFRRLVFNEPSSSDNAFLTVQEVRDARDATLTEPTQPDLFASYALGIDLGLTHDWTAAVLVHLDRNRKAVVDLTRTWRGSKGRPVNLADVEEEIVTLSQRFRPSRIVVDAWQAEYLRQRLYNRGVEGVQTTTIDPAHLDKLATLTKSVFAERAIRISHGEHDLLEQLETLEAQEMGAKNRRRDRLRFTSGRGTTAAQAHDDIALAMSLALEVLEERRRGIARSPVACVYANNRFTRELLQQQEWRERLDRLRAAKECQARRSVRTRLLTEFS